MSVANLCALCNNVLVANPVNQRHLSALSGSHVLAQCKRHAVLLARVMLLVTTCTGDVACQGEGKAHLLHYTFTHTFATRHVRTNVSLTLERWAAHRHVSRPKSAARCLSHRFASAGDFIGF